MVDAVSGERTKAADRGLPGGPHQPPHIEAVSFSQSAQVGGQNRGTVELAGLDAHPDLQHPCVADGVWTLGEAKLFGALRRLRELGFGAREIAVHKAR